MQEEILLVAESVSSEKGLAQEVIFEAIESALATATKRRYKEPSNILVNICLLYTSPSPRDRG